MRLSPHRVDVLERGAPLIGLAAVLLFHSLQYNFVTDDAYISFVYSRNLAEHGSLVFNLGDPVEGYTNFLWTFLLGVLMTVGLPPELMSLVLGTGFGLGTMWLAYRLVSVVRGDRSRWDYVAPALLALASGFACWSSGGLETQMFTFWVTLALYFYARSELEPRALRKVGVALALAAMTRPEGLLVAAVIGMHRLVTNLVRDRRLLPSADEMACLGWFALIWAPWFLWRWWYYGHPFPNTYYVKAAGAATEAYEKNIVASGLYYVAQWARQTRLVWMLPVVAVGFLLARPRSARFSFGTLAALLATVYLVYTVRVGGDFMGLHRFVMPLFVLGALGVTLGLATIASSIRHERYQLAVAAVLSVAVVGAFGYDQARLTVTSLKHWRADRGIDTPGYLWVYAHDRELIGRHMADCFLPDDFSIFGGVGAKPYYARTSGIDVFGLVSSRIAHEVPRTVARPGHNKWAPNKLLAEHDPTFVFSCYSIHNNPKRPGWNCSPGYWQARGYEPVTLHIPGLIERGEYYTFLVKKDRRFSCKGMVQ